MTARLAASVLPGADRKLAVSVQGAAELMSVAERAVWDEIAANRLRSFKIGRRRLIRVVEVEAYLERRELLAANGRAGLEVVRPAAARATASPRQGGQGR